MKHKKKKNDYKVLLQWIVPLLLILAWYAATNSDAGNTIFPSPAKVVTRAISMLKNGQLLEYTEVSAKRAIIGFIIGGGIGFLLGLMNGLWKLSDIALNTTIQMLRNIPVLALISLMIVWFGIGERVKVIMVAFGVFFPVYINTYHGIKSLDKGLIEMGKVYGLKGFALFRDIIFPGALSSILVGVRLSLGTMWLILIAAETIAADAGIGYMAMTARELMQMDKVVLSIIIYALLGKLSDVIASWLERRLLQWRVVS
ncbi:MAG: ssuC [Herbinix sp.]|jgi:sulfonate transport system permease protein|nr:ssuC [Herbinix sp.]